MERVCVFPKDVVRLIGLSEREAQKLIRDIRLALNKCKHQYVTKREFAQYTGISEDLIKLD
jgi:hypothetical protein